MRTIHMLAPSLLLIAGCAQQGAFENSAQHGAVGATTEGTDSAFASTSDALESGLTIDNVTVTGKLVAAVNSGVVMVDQLASGGTGTNGDPWVGWEAPLNALPGGLEIHFPAGSYTQSATIRVKGGWTLRGAGKDASIITSTSTFNGDALQSVSPYNGSTAVGLVVEDLRLVSTNPTPRGAAIDIVAGSFVSINRVFALNYKYSVVLDQAEVADIADSQFVASITTAAAGVWIVNGAEHQQQQVDGVPPTPAPLPGFTNRIGVRNTQFNAVSFIGVQDDGGNSHVFDTNNFSGGTVGLKLTAVSAGRVTGNQMGYQSSLAVQSLQDNLGLYIGENHASVGAPNAMAFAAGSEVTLANNIVESSGVAFTGLANLQQITAFGNRQIGTGSLYDADAVAGVVYNGGLGIQTATPGAELEVNGGVRLITSKVQPACGAATRGELWFVQGTVNVKDGLQVCAKGSGNNYLWRTLY